MTPIRALCFDLDMTLLDYGNDAYLRTVDCVCRDLATAHHEVDAAALAPQYREIQQQRWSIEGTASGADHASDGYAYWRETWALDLAAVGCHEPAVVDKALSLYARYRHEHYPLFDDVLPVLDALRPAYKLAVIANGPGTTQRDKLVYMQLEAYFDYCAISGEMGSHKPDAAIFEQTLGRLGVAADEALHVGDGLSADVAGALGAGMTAVWLNRKGVSRAVGDPEQHHEVASLVELRRWLGAKE
jgi:putative hydrolase of the HAD superfamily